jgi:antibiotic biosynthesis monooxygenase (ABM) superfamily enzyme
MLQPYLIGRQKGTKGYLKLFRRLLSAAIRNAMVMYWSIPNNKNIGSLIFRCSLANALWKNTVLVLLVMYTAIYRFNYCLKDMQNISWSIFL